MCIFFIWLFGIYGFFMIKLGCLDGDFWYEGICFYDIEDVNLNNFWFDFYDLVGRVVKNDME